MITLIENIAAGNALRLFITPGAGALKWRVLRRTADNFTGSDDAGAVLVAEGDDNVILDRKALVNGTAYYYKAYYWDGLAWTASTTVPAVPQATYEGDQNDVLSLVRERLELGLQVEVARGVLHPKTGRIGVLTAPPEAKDTFFPVVTIHLDSDASAERGLGEMLAPDIELDGIGWEESEGWLARVQLSIIGWALNPDERIALRRAIKRIILANLPVFDDAGMVQIELSQQDTEELERYPAQMYLVQSTLTCYAPAFVGDTASAIRDITTTVESTHG